MKLVDGSGEEFDAKLVLHDEDLGIAFVALDRQSDNADAWSDEPIDIAEDIEITHLDEVVIISRTSEAMRFQPAVKIGEVSTVVRRPRLLYSVGSLSSGSAVFHLDGQFVGLSIRKLSSDGDFRAVLPAKYIRKLLPQAIEKTANTAEDVAADGDKEEDEEEKNKVTTDKAPASADADFDQ